jgi:hypothetical protein
MLHIDHAALGGAVALNVALRCRQRGMPCQFLDITQAAASFHDLLCYPGNERAPAGMRACAAKTKFLIEPVEPHLHRTSAHTGIALAVDDVIAWVGIAVSVQLQQCIAQQTEWGLVN